MCLLLWNVNRFSPPSLVPKIMAFTDMHIWNKSVKYKAVSLYCSFNTYTAMPFITFSSFIVDIFGCVHLYLNCTYFENVQNTIELRRRALLWIQVLTYALLRYTFIYMYIVHVCVWDVFLWFNFNYIILVLFCILQLSMSVHAHAWCRLALSRTKNSTIL